MLHWFLTTPANLIHAASPILKSYGLPAVFALLFIESAGVVFAPGEAMIVAAGFLAARGLFPVWIALPLAMLAATLGGYAAYGLGGRYGHKALLRYGRYVGIMPPMKEPMSLGLCEKTLQRTLYVEETRTRVADRQGLPPDTNDRNGYEACFPSAPRICAQYLSTETE